KNNEIMFTPGQKDALTLMTTSKDREIAIQGDAGTGKTYVMRWAKEIFETNGYVVKGFAPTGKAVQELEYGGSIKSQTVSSYLIKGDRPGNLLQQQKGEVWIIDEAGMVGSKDMEQMLSRAQKGNTKVILVGDKKQFESIDQGKVFKDLQKIGAINFVEMRDNRRQKTEETRAIVKCFNEYIRGSKDVEVGNKIPTREQTKDVKVTKKGVNKYIDEAFDILKKSNSIREDTRDGGIKERFLLIKNEYLDSIDKNQRALIITSTNSNRVILNEVIRTELKNQGIVNQKGSNFTILSSIGLSGAEKMYAESYQKGYVVFFRERLNDITRGTKGEIVGVDIGQNSITISYNQKHQKESKLITISLDSEKDASKLQVFAKNEREFCQGDKIIFCKNDRILGVKNGHTAFIKEINSNGDCIAKLETKLKNIVISFNLNEQGKSPYPYVDHAYVLTDYKSQGTTVDKLIWSIESKSANLLPLF
ncbi:MAG: AAA family ATPase, partial [Oligoflexia bacterium]|nr:AAA family ATPase [Oligoflexia bacterium]